MTEQQLKDIEVEKYADVKNFVRKTLLENCKFVDSALKLPDGKDYIQYFMFETQYGDSTAFASTATMMFRMCGIPARYVEGYVIPSNIFTKTSTGKYTALLQDDNAHAWTEIYIPGIGWSCVETTPGFEGELNNLEMPEDVKDKEDEKEAEEKDENKGESKQQPKEYIALIIIVAILVVVVLLILRKSILRRYKKGYFHKNSADCVKRLFYSFYELLLWDGFSKTIDVTDEEFIYEVLKLYPDFTKERMTKYMDIVLRTHFGPNEVSTEMVEYSRKIYELLLEIVRERLSLRKKIIFAIWKVF